MSATTIKPTDRARLRLLAEIKQTLFHLRALVRKVASDPHLREFFTERAAIREFEGKLSQSDAELLALADVLTVALQRANAATVQPAAKSA